MARSGRMSLTVPGVSGYLGGELAYRYGVRVADEATQAKDYTSARRQDRIGTTR
jgi:hypothetical protein